MSMSKQMRKRCKRRGEEVEWPGRSGDWPFQGEATLHRGVKSTARRVFT